MYPINFRFQGIILLFLLLWGWLPTHLQAQAKSTLSASLSQYLAATSNSMTPAQMPEGLHLLDLCKASGTCPAEDQARLLIRLGRQSLIDGRPDACIVYLDEGIPLLDIKICENQDRVGDAFLIKSQALASMGDLEGSKAVLQYVLHAFDDSPKLVASANANLGTIAIMEQNYGQGREYLLNALEMSIAVNGPIHLYVGNCYNNLAHIESELGHSALSDIYMQKSLAIKETTYGPKSPSLITTLVNLSANAFRQGKVREAVQHARRAAYICREANGQNHPRLRPMLINLCNYYNELGERDSALACLNQALEINAATYDPSHPDAVRTYLEASDCFISLDMPDQAREYIALVSSLIAYDPRRRFDFEQVRSLDELEYLLACQEKLYRYRAGKMPQYADSITQSLCQRLAIFEYHMLQPTSTADRQLSTQVAYPLFEAMLNHLYDTDSVGHMAQMFGVMERSKSRLLREAVQQSNAGGYAGLPPQVLAREMALDAAIADLEGQRYAMSAGHAPDAELGTVSQALLAARRDKISFIALLRQYFPDYYRLRYQADVVSLADLQATLPQDRSFISYFEGDSTLFIACVNADEAQIVRMPKGEGLDSLLHQLRAGIMGYWASRDRDSQKHASHSRTYCEAAHGLYLQLLAPLAGHLRTELVIVPDGMLHYLPFDALLCKPAANPMDFRAHDYLIHRHLISYQYAATLYAQPRLAAEAPTQPLLALAPQFGEPSKASSEDNPSEQAKYVERGSLGALQHNETEAIAVADIWGGKAVVGEAATLSGFQAMAADYEILHLATHAKSNDQTGELSYIAFAADTLHPDLPQRLFAHDLFNARFHAELVVLSACETGIGELRRGEGMISLSRGFMYAGARSTVTSLWAVDDAQTQTLMADFHRFLKKGMRKDAALRAAKLQFLENAAYPHPYFWAGFVPMGDMQPMEDGNGIGLWLLLALLAIGITMLIMTDMRAR
jgi:CHAT domain-containing protein